jgi:guanine deaminase
MSENKLEILLVADQFKDEDCHTYASVYEKYGLMGDGTILAHCVHLDAQEREVIRRTGAGVSHCPSSNLFLSSGAARVRDLLNEGIKVSLRLYMSSLPTICILQGKKAQGKKADWQVGLGTDCSGGPHISILNTIRDASNVSRAISFTDEAYKPFTAPELFYLATMGGARLCRLQDTIGSLQPGKDFDAVWVKPASPGMWHGMSRAEWLARQRGDGTGLKRIRARTREDVRRVWEKWIWTGDDRDLAGVWVRGRRVVP